MKRFFTVLMIAAVVLGASQPLMAQQKGEWNVKVGAGWFSAPDFVGLLVAGLGSIDTTEGTSSQEFIPLINPNVEVLYGVSDWCSLGGSMAMGYSAAKSVFDVTGEVNRSSSAFYNTLCLSAQTRYFRRGNFAMYGSWGVGLCALYAMQRSADGNTNNNNFAATFMANAYPLCFEMGEKVSCFVEVGWGAKGIVNVGVNF